MKSSASGFTLSFLCLVFAGVWAYLSIATSSMVVPPTEILALLTAAFGNDAWQGRHGKGNQC